MPWQTKEHDPANSSALISALGMIWILFYSAFYNYSVLVRPNHTEALIYIILSIILLCTCSRILYSYAEKYKLNYISDFTVYVTQQI